MTATGPPPRRRRPEDRRAAGRPRLRRHSPGPPASSIMLALAGVFVFLAIEGCPGLQRRPRSLPAGAPTSRATSGPLVFGTVLAAVHRADPRRPVRDRHRAVRLPLRAARIAAPDRLRDRPARRRAQRGLRPLGRSASCAGYLSRLTTGWHENLGFLPFFAGPPSATGRTHAHRRHGAGDHDPADHHRDLARGVRPDAAAARGGRARARRHPLGDDPARRLPLRPLRHDLRR